MTSDLARHGTKPDQAGKKSASRTRSPFLANFRVADDPEVMSELPRIASMTASTVPRVLVSRVSKVGMTDARLPKKWEPRSSPSDQRWFRSVSQLDKSVRGAELFAGNEFTSKRPSGETAY